jgi:hypothetical protein
MGGVRISPSIRADKEWVKVLIRVYFFIFRGSDAPFEYNFDYRGLPSAYNNKSLTTVVRT